MLTTSATAPPARLQALFQAWAGQPATTTEAIPRAGSDRRYWRLTAGSNTAIGTFNPDARENRAFLTYARHFRALDLPVPEIYAADEAAQVYLQQDVGRESLLQRLQSLCQSGHPDPQAEIAPLYRESLTQLARLQIFGAPDLDFSVAYPRAAFDQQSMLWDLSYFKYYFLKLAGIPFDEQRLEDDFQRLAAYLLSADTQHFLFRDFQGRNIMLQDDRPCFIDFQGGRRGALQYDVASLLFQAKAALSPDFRTEMLQHYLGEVRRYLPLDEAAFRRHYAGYVLIRLIQVLGAYGFRGLYEQRPHFRESIPLGLQNLHWWRENEHLPVELPELMRALRALDTSPKLQALTRKWEQLSPLTVRVVSFSYKKGLPRDPSGNGGGFFFDCRGLHNPGRYPPYKKLTGRDPSVIDFLQHNSRVGEFLHDAERMVDISVQSYIKRDFSHLLVGFGCTGGQHRSVYCADQLAAYLRQKYPTIRVEVQHIVQEAKNWINE
ncbi:MAG: RNase adapter RapZ [Bacteroidota bacterium]